MPARAALQKCEASPVGVDGQPAPLAACLRNLLMRVADVFEIQFPVPVGFISQMLRLAGDRIDLPTRCADLRNDALIRIAP